MPAGKNYDRRFTFLDDRRSPGLGLRVQYPDASMRSTSLLVPPTVIDTSDTGADLAWTPVPGIAVYRISRAGADGRFVPVGDTAGASFADSDLKAETTYRWHISAVVNGIEGPSSAEASATTRQTPAPCDNPGSCAIGK